MESAVDYVNYLRDVEASPSSLVWIRELFARLTCPNQLILRRGKG